MIPIPASLGTGDINQWLNRGVVLVRLDGELVPAMYEEARYNSNDTLCAACMSLDGQKQIFAPFEHVFAHWPRCGAVNVGPVALYVQRTQTRQYRRTYNQRCITVSMPDQTLASSIVGETMVMQALTYRNYTAAVFAPEYPDVDEALRDLDLEQRFSVALSPTTILVRHSGAIRVYYNGDLLAKLCDGRLIPLRGKLPRAITKRLGGVRC